MTRNGFPPRLFLIGAQRCATTYFAEVLNRHPDIELAKAKEVDYFSLHYPKGPDWYRSAFSDDENHVFFDASPSYAAEPYDKKEQTCDNPRHDVAARLHQASPDAHILYMVRDPVLRTYSAYWHHVQMGSEKRPFKQAVEESSWYLDLSRYHFQIQQYLKYFPKERIHILNAKDCTKNPADEAAKIWQALGLREYASGPIATDRRNSSYKYNRLGKLLISSATGKSFLRMAAGMSRRILPGKVIESVRRVFTDGIPPISAEDYRDIQCILADDMEQFAQLSGLDFRHSSQL